MEKKVLTVTMNPALDVGSEAYEVFTDEKVRCQKPVYDPGGGGVNVARVLTRLGCKVDALFVAGGVTGHFLKSLLRYEDISEKPIDISEATRESITITENKTGKQYRFVFPGPYLEEKVWGEVLKEVEREISDYDFVVASGSLPPGVPVDFYSRLGKVVLENGKQYLLDASGDYLLQGINSGATFIKPNEEEFLELMSSMNLTEESDLIAKLQSMGVENIVHTLGKEGTILYNKNGKYKFTPPKITVKSAVGAGDSFVGGLIGGLSKDKSVEDAVCYGIAAAASTLQSPGTKLCQLEEVEEISKSLCDKNK